MASTSDPTVLNAATRLRPRSFLGQSRSPSRSPHIPQFAAQELDPLLGNLSPDSTLHALQATETISGSQKVPDALSKSIADASAFERELGVRAALAAQKIRGWLREVTAWSWPDARASTLGLGFSAPAVNETSANDPSVGHLRTSQIHQYEERLSEIQGALDALEIEEVKDYVLNAHVPVQSGQKPRFGTGIDHRMSYGRMRDFTALITATVIRALPDLAQLNILIILWKARLTVLQLIPEFLQKLDSTRREVQNATHSIRDEASGSKMKQAEYESVKSTLASQVASIGSEVDRMLDVLEGHEDRLPQGWIDTLETIELDFAGWVVEAQRKVQHNVWMASSTNHDPNTSLYPQPHHAVLNEPEHFSPESPIHAPSNEAPSNQLEVFNPERYGLDDALVTQQLADILERDAIASDMPDSNLEHTPSPTQIENPSSNIPEPSNPTINSSPVCPQIPQLIQDDDDDRSQTPLALPSDKLFNFPVSLQVKPRPGSQRGPPLTLELPKPGHKREVSEVSFADSAYSAFSDISNAEIIDATATEVVTSPKISVVDNPFRASRDDLSSFVTSSALRGGDFKASESASDYSMDAQDLENQYAPRPTYVQRASTASMELIERSQIKRVVLNRSASQDLMTLVSKKTETTPLGALERLNGDNRGTASLTNLTSLIPTGPLDIGNVSKSSLRARGSSPLSSPNPDLSPMQLDDPQFPALPRRSSKRLKDDAHNPATPVSATSSKIGGPSSPEVERKNSAPSNSESFPVLPGKPRSNETLQAKIQDILTSLPTVIKLANESDSSGSPSMASTASSSRSTTPAPALVLSPAKKDKTRRSTGNDSEVRVYHLTRPGQPRDAPPTKLFVRLVGENGERVMVRVGGGWADLKEYLREYSLHHGRRSTVEGRLEVANFPAKRPSPKDVVVRSPPIGPGGLSKAPTGLNSLKTKSRSSSGSGSAFDFATLRDIDPQKGRRVTAPAGRALSPDLRSWSPPPVPAIPSSYTVHGATTTSTVSSKGVSTTVVPSNHITSSVHSQTTVADPGSRSPITSVTSSPNLSTTTTFYSPTISSQNYTPLGAAGPKSAIKNSSRRVTTTSSSENEAWVEGLVGKARAVSGSALSPSTTTTTTGSGSMTTTTTLSIPMSGSKRASPPVVESPASGRNTPNFLRVTPTSRRVSAIKNDSPVSGRSSPTGRASPSPAPSAEESSPGGGSQRSKSRMSFGDVSGIKRVFLRRKSEK